MKKTGLILGIGGLFLLLSCSRNVGGSQQTFFGNAPASDSVSNGYGKTASRNTTGAGSSVEHPKTIMTLDNYLRGLAGVNVNGSGASASVTIRGISSFQAGSNEPLFVVNGTPMGSYAIAYSIINPFDIKRVTALTDAASTGIYGVRGANGVIVITLKNGQ